jgi:hypothetical protein
MLLRELLSDHPNSRYLQTKDASNDFKGDFRYSYQSNAGGKSVILALKDPAEIKRRLDFVIANMADQYKRYYPGKSSADYKQFWTDFFEQELAYYRKMRTKDAGFVDLSYKGNMGFEEMAKFMKVATPEQQKLMDAIIDKSDWDGYKKLIKSVLGVTLDAMESLDYQGLQITIENPVGSTREGTKSDGTKFKTTFYMPYGFINNTTGSDKEEIDCFIGPNMYASNVYIIHQNDRGAYDEDKVMLGFDNGQAAVMAYLAHFDTQAKIDSTTEMTLVEFKQMLANHVGGKLTIDDDHSYCRQSCMMKKQAAEKAGIKVPELSATYTKIGMNRQYFVQGTGLNYNTKADCAWDAKMKAIEHLMGE